MDLARKSTEVKIVLLGDAGVGKTSLVYRFVHNQFLRTAPTIVASYATKDLEIEDEIIKLLIWDTAGQDRFRSLAPMYYRGAVAAILVFDLCDTNSFLKMKDWALELQTNIQEDIILVLVGNKLDRIEKNPENRKVSKDDALTYASTINATYCEVSAKINKGIEEIFLTIGNKVLELKKIRN
eukprot:TRINITY_DN5004_c0_g1_i2.p1 TRINITY_DN5004_c0_g1~~TRINITY_DN5004_c0_g1_i2.p1  ORF type:complete len:182 (+),score=27.23 TRINITY_DN5004_c0_g1_i2:53-598(+)